MNTYTKYLLGLVALPFLFSALIAFAQTPLPSSPIPNLPASLPLPGASPASTPTPPPQSQSVSFPYWPSEELPLISCTGDYTNYQGLNKGAKECTSLCDVISTFQRILYFVMTLILFIGAPIMFVVGGGMIFFAGPNPSLLEQGRKVIWGAVIGVVLALSAYIIVGTFLWLIGNPSPGTKTVKGPDGKDVKVAVQRVSWPNIVCDPAKMPGGELNLWRGNATGGQITPPPESNLGSSSCFLPPNAHKQTCFPGPGCGGNGAKGNCLGPCTEFAGTGCASSPPPAPTPKSSGCLLQDTKFGCTDSNLECGGLDCAVKCLQYAKPGCKN